MTKKDLKELMNLPLTDFGNAQRLQILFGKRWVYLPKFHYWMYRDMQMEEMVVREEVVGLVNNYLGAELYEQR